MPPPPPPPFLLPRGTLLIIFAAFMMLVLYSSSLPPSSSLPWAVLCAVVVLLVAHERGFVELPTAVRRLFYVVDGDDSLAEAGMPPQGGGGGGGGRQQKRRGGFAGDVVDALVTSPTDPAVGGGSRGELVDDQFIPSLFSVQRLEGREAWLRGDEDMVRALLHLRPYRLTDSPTVRTIVQLLGEFYRRYDRLLNRPLTVHVANEYTLMHDIAIAVLNALHELHFSRPPMLNRGLEVPTREVMSRTSRMMRALRHKYPTELRGAPEAMAGAAPRAHEASAPPSSPAWPSYALYT